MGDRPQTTATILVLPDLAERAAPADKLHFTTGAANRGR